MVILATTGWGLPTAERRALLIHGLTSAGRTWWRVGESLAADGWFACAVDLRGNGRSPDAESYRLDEYASDLPGAGWDVVISHSLGTAVSVIAASAPEFARRLVLIDPVLAVAEENADELLASELSELRLTRDGLRALRPGWSERDIDEKHATLGPARTNMVERTVRDNPDWNVVDELNGLGIPTLILSGDPAVFSMLSAELADAVVAANPLVTYRIVDGSGHSPHRDRPEETLAILRDWLADS